MQLDRFRNYGIVYGGGAIKYVQDGICYDGAGNPITTEAAHNAPPGKAIEEHVNLSDSVEAATEFLKQILKLDARAKSIIYSEAEKNNQLWESVVEARKVLKLRVFTVKGSEMWALPRE